MNDYFEQVSHDLGFKSAEREQQRKEFMLDAEKQLSMRGLKLDWAIKLESTRGEIAEQELRREAELRGRQDYLEAELTEEQKRAELRNAQAKAKAEADKEVALSGIEVLRKVKEAKHEALVREKDLELEVRKHLLDLHQNASLQALLATVSGEQADRLLKLAEMEMRKGMTAEQSLAFVAEKKSDDFAPALAAALKAKFAGPQSAE